MFSPAELAARLEDAAADIPAALLAPTTEFVELAEHTAAKAIGTYEFGWPPLADSTMDDRARQGYAPNEPLLRTGELRSSIHSMAAITGIGADGLVYSPDKIALYQELGTDRIPPRSFLYASLVRTIPALGRLFGPVALRLLSS